MSIAPGWTSEEIREFVHEYQLVPHGSKGSWLAARGVPYDTTMKYRPGYPKVFTDLTAARAYLADYVPWYNDQHKHSGIALFSPRQVHDGTWQQAWKRRDDALQRYFEQHPERFHARPVTPTPASTVGINLPNEKPRNQAA